MSDPKPPSHAQGANPESAERERYRQLRERNERRQHQRQLKLARLTERDARRRPQSFRHPSR